MLSYAYREHVYLSVIRLMTELIILIHCTCIICDIFCQLTSLSHNKSAHTLLRREFFHLLSQQLVDPQYALFQNINGFYKPCQLSSIDPNHLTFFQFFGKILGRAICDGEELPTLCRYIV